MSPRSPGTTRARPVHRLHFAPGDPADLARQLRRLWDDPTLCRTLGTAAHHDVAARFCEDAHFTRLIAAYDRALVRATA